MDLMEYIIGEALILIPVLLIIGQIIKKIEIFPDKYIPVILLGFGVVGALALMLPTGSNVVNAVIQGILVAGAAVFGNQIVKQLKKDE